MAITKKEKSQKNYYKIATYLLAGIIILALIVGIFNSLQNTAYNNGIQEGQYQSVDYILYSISNDGFVNINVGNETIALVLSDAVEISRQQTVSEIMGYIKDSGYVVLNDTQDEMVLVQYLEEE